MKKLFLVACLFLLGCPPMGTQASNTGDADSVQRGMTNEDKEDIIIQQSFNSWGW